MNKILTILLDALILFAVSTVFVYLADLGFSGLKKKIPKDDPVVTAIVQGDIGNVESVLKEVKAKQDINVKVVAKTDEHGRTALMRAAYANLSSAEAIAKTDEKRAPMIALLVEHGAPKDARDNDGWTALMWASWSGLDKTADRLLEAGAKPSVADMLGNTALSIAALRGNAAIVRSLMDKGADPSAVTLAGKTALDNARKGLAEYPGKKAAYQDVMTLLGVK